MSYQIKIDEILEAMSDSEHPLFQEHKHVIETAVTGAAKSLAFHLDVRCGEASFEGLGLAGTCVPFWAKEEGQPCPDAIEEFDAPAYENWHTQNGDPESEKNR